MEDIRQERSNKGPILSFNKRLSRQSLNKKFGIHFEKSMVFKTLKNKQSIIPGNKVVSGKPCGGGENLVLPKSQRSHNPKTWKHILKRFGIYSKT